MCTGFLSPSLQICNWFSAIRIAVAILYLLLLYFLLLYLLWFVVCCIVAVRFKQAYSSVYFWRQKAGSTKLQCLLNLTLTETINTLFLVNFLKMCCYRSRLFSIVAFKTLDISQGSVATHLRCGGIFSDSIITNFLLILRVKQFWKSVNIWSS